MKLFVGLLLLMTIFNIKIANSTGLIDASDSVGYGSSNSDLNSFNNSISNTSNNTITHVTTLNPDLNHLVVDRNTGRVSFLTWKIVFSENASN